MTIQSSFIAKVDCTHNSITCTQEIFHFFKLFVNFDPTEARCADRVAAWIEHFIVEILPNAQNTHSFGATSHLLALDCELSVLGCMFVLKNLSDDMIYI